MTLKNKQTAVPVELCSLYEEFKKNAGQVSARVYRVPNSPGAVMVIKEIVEEKGVKNIAVAPSRLVDSLALDEALGGLVPAIHRRDLRLYAPDSDLGITGVDLAVAETGTLVHDATDVDSRLVSMLPPVHVALVRTDGLVATLRDALEHYNGNLKGLPAYLAFISGPSRTADIERVLTIGVHGPGELHIIFIDRPGGGKR